MINKLNFYYKLTCSLLTLISVCLLELSAQNNNTNPLILDMVHHNPGDTPYESAYNNPAVIKKMGYNGKVYFLFESPALAINWESVDPD